MILATLASAMILKVSDPAVSAAAAEKAYVACMATAAQKADFHVPADHKAMAAAIEAACQDEAWTYLIAVKLARPDRSSTDPRAHNVVVRETEKAIRLERKVHPQGALAP